MRKITLFNRHTSYPFTIDGKARTCYAIQISKGYRMYICEGNYVVAFVDGEIYHIPFNNIGNAFRYVKALPFSI